MTIKSIEQDFIEKVSEMVFLQMQISKNPLGYR